VVLTETVHPGLASVYDLAALGRYPHTGWSGLMADEDHRAVREALASVGALELAHRPVADLSDGERQKVMIARALAQEPRLLVLDEITAFLDLPRRVEVMRLLRRLAHSSRRAVLVSSHDLDLALRSADRLWLLPKGGKLEAGAPEDLVLSGAFEAAFAAEGVAFDREEGSFHVHRDARGEVELSGEGLELLWTRRALERQGLKVAREGTRRDVRVEVESGEGRTRWNLFRDGQSRQYDTLYDLTLELRDPS
jgi:iron complex transport system ATP-binding protein